MLAIRATEAELIDEAATSIAGMTDSWQRLERLIELSVAREVHDPDWALWLEIWAESLDHPEIAAIHHELDGRWRELLSQVLEAGMADGAFRRSPVADAAMLISTSLDGLSTQLTVGTPGFSPAELRRLATTLCSALLAPGTG
jgi:FAD/FMN-containing dehydrogenase